MQRNGFWFSSSLHAVPARVVRGSSALFGRDTRALAAAPALRIPRNFAVVKNCSAGPVLPPIEKFSDPLRCGRKRVAFIGLCTVARPAERLQIARVKPAIEGDADRHDMIKDDLGRVH
jgi:hypothetical protein